jgi:hypothetical protein
VGFGIVTYGRHGDLIMMVSQTEAPI